MKINLRLFCFKQQLHAPVGADAFADGWFNFQLHQADERFKMELLCWRPSLDLPDMYRVRLVPVQRLLIAAVYRLSNRISAGPVQVDIRHHSDSSWRWRHANKRAVRRLECRGSGEQCNSVQWRCWPLACCLVCGTSTQVCSHKCAVRCR